MNKEIKTKEELESAFEDCYDKHTSATGGGYEADYTDKNGFYAEFEPFIFEYAKQQTLAFIKWYFTEALKMEVENFDEGLLFVDLDNDKITKEQLFTIFINDVNK